MQDKYYNQIKEEFINNEAYKKVKDYSKNKNDLETYYKVGKLLIEAQGGEARAKYGNELIKKYSKRLTNELGKGYTITNLKNMRKFYLLCKKGHTVCDFLSWSHYRELIKFKDLNEIDYYIQIIKEQNLSVRKLQFIVKNKEYERLDNKTKNKLIKKESTNVIDFVKNPIVIKTNGKEILSEKILHELILENIGLFLKELGPGFSFIDSEYKIKIGNTYNFIDLLLFNYKYNCFIVVELKVTELKKEHIGQIEIYMNYIDKNLKTISQNKTIGIIICKKDNKLVLSYCSDDRIYATKYISI